MTFCVQDHYYRRLRRSFKKRHWIRHLVLIIKTLFFLKNVSKKYFKKGIHQGISGQVVTYLYWKATNFIAQNTLTTQVEKKNPEKNAYNLKC